MKNKLSMSGMMLGVLAASLAGCGDQSVNAPQQTKSAITSRGFVTNGCTGTGVFDITSNNLINFVALDQSSFSNVDARVYALDKNNQEQEISSSQNAGSISSSLAQLLNEVSNYQSAYQRAKQMAEQNTASYENAYAANRSLNASIGSTNTTASHDANSYSSQFTRTRATGYNDQESSNDAHAYQRVGSATRSFQAADAMQRAIQSTDQNDFANAGNWAGASNSARNGGYSHSNNGSSADSSNDANSWSSGGARSGAVDVGWAGVAPFLMNRSAYFNDALYSKQFANASNNASADANSNQYAGLWNGSFSDIFSHANQGAFNDVHTDQATFGLQHSLARSAAANEQITGSNVHNDARSHTAYDTGSFNKVETGSHQHQDTADSATTQNYAANANSTGSWRGAMAGSEAESLSQAGSESGALTRSNSQSQQFAKQYQALTNLNQYGANQIVLRLNVTANDQNAVLRVFTGNEQNNVAANNEFAQSFPGCGGAVPIRTPGRLVPVTAPMMNQASPAVLGDRIAKPE